MGYGMQGTKAPKGYETGRMANFTPEMMQQFQSLFPHLGKDSFLSKLAGGDQSQFAQLEAPALRQFNELQGGLASRFSGMGMGARKSSGFQNMANSAASNFAQELQSQRLGLQMQALRDLMGMSNTLLNQRPYENYMVQKQPKQNPWADIAGGFAKGIPAALTGFMTGGFPGAAIGGLGSVYDQEFRMNPAMMGYPQ